MKSKQTVNAVLNHQTPEYIPLGTYAIDCDTAARVIGRETYVRNKAKIQIALWEGRRDEVLQSLKEDSVELFNRLGAIDIIIPYKEAPILPPEGYKPPKVEKVSDTVWREENGTVHAFSPVTNEFSVVQRPREAFDYTDAPKLTPPDPTIFQAYDHLVDALKDSRFIAGLCGGFNSMPLLGGMEDGLCLYYEDPELIERAIKYINTQQNFKDTYYIKEGVDQVFIEEDMATTISPFMSPQMYREFCFEAAKQRIANIKTHRDKVIFHCCGSTRVYMDMFVEMGIDMYQSLQTGANMDIAGLKADFGKQMAFWGGVSVEKLIDGTPEQVRQDVRHALEHCSANGGFVLGPSHSVAYGVGYDNFMAMLDEHDKLKARFI